MLASITPLGERSRHNRWWLTATAYEIGSVVGGGVLGVIGGALGLGIGTALSLSDGSRLAVAVVACAAAVLLDSVQGGRFMRGPNRQVDRRWLDRYRGSVYGGGFGLQLGFGLVTIVNSAAMYALVVLLVMLESPLDGTVIGAIFGLARAFPLLAFSRATDFARLQGAHRRIQALSQTSRRGTILALSVVATGLGGVGLFGLLTTTGRAHGA